MELLTVYVVVDDKPQAELTVYPGCLPCIGDDLTLDGDVFRVMNRLWNIDTDTPTCMLWCVTKE